MESHSEHAVGIGRYHGDGLGQDYRGIVLYHPGMLVDATWDLVLDHEVLALILRLHYVHGHPMIEGLAVSEQHLLEFIINGGVNDIEVYR